MVTFYSFQTKSVFYYIRLWLWRVSVVCPNYDEFLNFMYLYHQGSEYCCFRHAARSEASLTLRIDRNSFHKRLSDLIGFLNSICSPGISRISILGSQLSVTLHSNLLWSIAGTTAACCNLLAIEMNLNEQNKALWAAAGDVDVPATARAVTLAKHHLASRQLCNVQLSNTRLSDSSLPA